MALLRAESMFQIGPVDQVVADGMTLAHIEVAQIGIFVTFIRLEKIDVPLVAIMGVPAVPDPFVFKYQCHLLDPYPFTPVDAIDAMNAR